MRVIDADVLEQFIHEYFKKLIEGHKSKVDITDCNAELHKIIEKQTTVRNWIPCDEMFPDTEEYILLSFANFSVPLVGRWEEDVNGGAFFVGDETESCISQGIIVNAWMPLPKAYEREVVL